MNATETRWCAEEHAEYGPCTLRFLHCGAHWNNETKEPWGLGEGPEGADTIGVLCDLLRRAYNYGCLPGDLQDEVLAVLRRFGNRPLV